MIDFKPIAGVFKPDDIVTALRDLDRGAFVVKAETRGRVTAVHANAVTVRWEAGGDSAFNSQAVLDEIARVVEEPVVEERPKPAALAPVMHPIDRALGALDEAVALLVTSGKRTRFAEILALSNLASQLQFLRPAAGVDDVPDAYNDGFGVGGVNVGMNMMNGAVMPMRPARFNDAVDLNREMIMVAQSFLKSYLETEKIKASKPAPDVRLNEVGELAELMELRMKLAQDGQDVPAEIGTRIEQLLRRIGEPPHEHHEPEPRPDPVVPAEPLRGHPPDGAGQLDGDRVGEPVADRA